VLPGHGPWKKTLKPEAVPSVFSFVPPAKRRKISEVLKWQSQPLVRNISTGNLLVAAGILFCGLTLTGISNLAKLLNLAMFSESTFYRLQREYLFPVVRTNYLMQQDAVVEFVRDSNLKLSSDGQCDSPAKYHLWTQPLTSF